MPKIANVTITLLAFLCAIHQSFQCSPPPDWNPPTITELTEKAPIVVRGFVVKKVGDSNLYTACLRISHVYKGSGVKSYICVSRFGSTAACLSDPAYGVEYLFFLNRKINEKLGTEYEARYDTIHSATRVFKKNSEDEVRDGKCCPGSSKSTYLYYHPI